MRQPCRIGRGAKNVRLGTRGYRIVRGSRAAPAQGRGTRSEEWRSPNKGGLRPGTAQGRVKTEPACVADAGRGHYGGLRPHATVWTREAGPAGDAARPEDRDQGVAASFAERITASNIASVSTPVLVL